MSNDQSITLTLSFNPSDLSIKERPKKAGGTIRFSEINLDSGTTTVRINGLEHHLNAYRAKNGKHYYSLSAIVPEFKRTSEPSKQMEIQLDEIAF